MVAIYAFEFARAGKGQETQLWHHFKVFLKDKARENEPLTLNSIVLISHALLSKKILEEKGIWEYLHK